MLTSLTLAAKIISREVNQAGLVRILGETGDINVHGEAVQKLDEFAQQTIYRAMGHSGHLCVMASEESEGIIPIPDGGKRGRYVLMFDPLDGSSNIDVNASIGTIFSIHGKSRPVKPTALLKIACNAAPISWRPDTSSTARAR